MALKIEYDAERDYSITSLTDVVHYIENRLGYLPSKSRGKLPPDRVEAAKLKRTMKNHWSDLSLEDLIDVAEWCFANREPLKSSVGLVYLSKRALEERDERRDDRRRLTIDENIELAIECEHRIEDLLSEYWIGRLTRARGKKARQMVFNHWYTERWAS